jgi:hypothetical protein
LAFIGGHKLKVMKNGKSFDPLLKFHFGTLIFLKQLTGVGRNSSIEIQISTWTTFPTTIMCCRMPQTETSPQCGQINKGFP